MPNNGPHYRRIRMALAPGSKFYDVPRGAFLTFAQVIGRELVTVWFCDSQDVGSRTFRVEYIEPGSNESRDFSPAWTHITTTTDLVGGYVSLLELTA